MSLPEPSFIERDATTVTRELIEMYELMTGKTLQPAQVERLLIDVIAYRENLLRIGIQEAAKQNLVEYARFPMLDYLGELVGVARLPAQSARTIIQISVEETQTFDILIPTGTRVETKDGRFIFATSANATIEAGQTSIEATAVSEASGAGANGYMAGEINNLVDPIGYIASAVNVSVSMGGTDEESDDRLRERIKGAPESFSNAGSKGAYKFWAMSAHQDIVDVAVMSLSPGEVNIYPLTKTGNPPDTTLDLVAATVNAEKRRPLTDLVNVLSPAEMDFEVLANVTLYANADTETASAQIQANLAAYVDFMKAALGRDVVRSQIIARINSVYGVYKTELISPAEDTVLNEYEWANCTGVTINIVGAVNG